MELPTWFRLNIEGFDDEVFVIENEGCVPHLSALNKKLNLEIAVCFNRDASVKIFMAVPRGTRQPSGRIMTEPGFGTINMQGFDPLTIRCIALSLAEHKSHIPMEVTVDG